MCSCWRAGGSGGRHAHDWNLGFLFSIPKFTHQNFKAYACGIALSASPFKFPKPDSSRFSLSESKPIRACSASKQFRSSLRMQPPPTLPPSPPSAARSSCHHILSTSPTDLASAFPRHHCRRRWQNADPVLRADEILRLIAAAAAAAAELQKTVRLQPCVAPWCLVSHSHGLQWHARSLARFCAFVLV